MCLALRLIGHDVARSTGQGRPDNVDRSISGRQSSTEEFPLPNVRALLLSDGKPGHFRCAEAIVEAVRRSRPVVVTTISIRRPTLVPNAALAWITAKNVSSSFLLKTFYAIDPDGLEDIDVIVSAGGDTLPPNIAAARLTGKPNVFFGSLRRFSPADFTLALNCYTTDRPAANQVRILKPAPADPATLPVPDLDHRRLPKVSGLLIGGPSGDARYSDRDWSQLFAFLEETRLRLGMAWIVSNSRRTPDAISQRCAALAGKPNGPIKHFIDVRNAGSGTLGALFEASGAIAVTSDSSAMISEGIWMRRPVVALRPKALQLPPKEDEYRRWLEGRNLCREIGLSDITAERYASALREVVPLNENPQTELTRLLADRLPDLFGASRAGA